MLSTAKLMFMAFFTILIGVILIQPIADDVDTASDSSITVTNETLSFSTGTGVISNETAILTNVSVRVDNETVATNAAFTTANLSFSDVIDFTALTNLSSENLIGFCNISLATGVLTCNATGDQTMYANYTYSDGKTHSLINDNLTVFTELRNITSEIITTECNVTLTSGTMVCNQTYAGIAYADYTHINRRTETLTNDEVLTLDEIRNATSSDVITGECNVTLSQGTLSCNNTHDTTGYVDYTYTPDTYVSSAVARTFLSNTILFFAIAVMVIGIGFAIAAFKQSGVI